MPSTELIASSTPFWIKHSKAEIAALGSIGIVSAIASIALGILFGPNSLVLGLSGSSLVSYGLACGIYDLKNQRSKNALIALEQNGPTLQTDRSFVLAAVTQNAHALKSADPKWLADQEVLLAAVTQNAHALKSAAEDLKSNKAFILEAVTRNWLALQFVDASFITDRDVALAAIKKFPRAICFVDESLRNDPEFVRRQAGLQQLQATLREQFLFPFKNNRLKNIFKLWKTLS